jgi:hypothetical protein
VSEVLVDPIGADDAASEFVELAGVPGTSLDGVLLVGSDEDADRVWLELALDGHGLDAEGRLLLGASGTSFSAGNLPSGLQNGPDQLVLLDCDGTTELDRLAWPRSGSNSGESWHSCGDAPAVAGPPSPGAADESSICTRTPIDGGEDVERESDAGVPADAPNGADGGGDADAAYVDLLDRTDLGERGDDAGEPPTPCEPAAGLVQIHEVYFDAIGPDEGQEFVELHGVPDTRLDGVELIGVNGRDGTTFWGPQSLGGQIGPSALVVVGQAMVLARDVALDGALQNGPDSIVLVDCDGTVIDAVAWGRFAEGEIGAGEGVAAVVPAPGQSLSRDSGADTDDNAADFASSSPTPGELARRP